MRKWFSTIDNKTNMLIVYSDCTYNMACFELQVKFGDPVSVTKENDMMRLDFGNGNLFFYDEERDYLLRPNPFPNGYQFFEEVM